MNIDFYFDPCCPFCWITSRWLLRVQPERQLNVTWQPFSLAIKNNELEGGTGDYADMHRAAHRILRVMQAAQDHGADYIDLYTAFGIPFHIAGEAFDDALIAKVLAQQKLPPELLQAAADTSYDASLAASTTTAANVAGNDIGVPTIVFTTDEGSKSGFFGPVLQELPDMEEALRLWDGLSSLATSSHFYELKRSRPDGLPDVFSTAKC